MLAFIDEIVIPFLNTLYGAFGYFGVGAAMAIESAMIPLPSELILPYAGFLVSDALFVAVGTPDKVANQIGEWGEMMGTNHFNLQAHVGDMPHWKAVKNLTLIAEEVIPRLRKRNPQAAQRAAAE